MSGVETEAEKEYEVREEEEIISLLRQGLENRKVGVTKCNEHSSRSHLLFTIILKSSKGSKNKVGSLTLIDLAGSENIEKSMVEGERKKEALFINTSLTQLGLVINSMVNNLSHIPFRNCKLTQTLQEYMTGDSKTLMIVNISPRE